MVNASYLEREQNEETKKKEYVYTPLVDAAEEEEQQEKGEGEDHHHEVSKTSNPDRFDKVLHVSKLFLPENHPEIPSDWLKQEILQLQRYRIDPPIFKILRKVPEEKELTIDEFIADYTKSQNLADFFKNMSSRFDTSKHREISISGGSNKPSDKEITTEKGKSREILSNHPKFDSEEDNNN